MSKRTSTKTSKSRSLETYRKKRDFTKSPEPAGDPTVANKRAKTSKKKLFFCVQKHLASHLHYDFRLEHRGVLLSWAVPKGPSLKPGDKRLAMMVEDHPWDYRNFEGVIEEGYGAGVVLLWDQGSWAPIEGFTDIDRALEKGQLKFRLDGQKLKGEFVLVRIRGSESRSWLLIKHRDEYSSETLDVTERAPWSVKTGGDFADIVAKKKPDVWESNRPARGGEAGKMYDQILRRVQELSAENGKAKRATKQSTSSNTTRARARSTTTGPTARRR
jgi:bifunctional non-homologous end joining protein LigD